MAAGTAGATGAAGSLAGRVAVVTGAGGGLGGAICAALAAAGAAVAAVDQHADTVQAVVAGLTSAGARASALAADVADADAVARCVTQVVQEFGGLDILVNNAAVYPRRAWTEITETEWDRVLAVNLKGYFLCARAAFPHLKAGGHGRIINLSSITFFLGMANLLDYVSSKGGIIGFTRALAREVGPDGVTVNAIAPGAFPTDAEKIHPDPEGYSRSVLDQQSLKRRGRPEDIGNAVAFLAGDGASFITGQTLMVDGGWQMH